MRLIDIFILLLREYRFVNYLDRFAPALMELCVIFEVYPARPPPSVPALSQMPVIVLCWPWSLWRRSSSLRPR